MYNKIKLSVSSKSRLLYLLIWVCFFLFLVELHAQPSGNKTYTNPIIPGFNPDPSICRVGSDYYVVTSTNEYFPGIPIYHSRDLVNWEMIGHALNRPTQINLDSIECSGGIYAPTLRYNKGVFYVISTLSAPKNVKIKGNFIVTATNPAGPWSEPHWIENASGIDPSLFFDDDGKVYYSGNYTPEKKLFEKHRNIWIQEIDLNTWKLIGNKVDVLDGSEYFLNNKIGNVNNYESSHLYKKDGKYYLMIAHGGTYENHAVSIWKSDSVFGPYEMNPSNPILTHRDLSKEYPITSTGHADLVQTQQGEWWVCFLAKRPYGGENHIMGRETFLSPVDWSGIWPIVNPNGKVGQAEITHNKPALTEFKNKNNYYDDFSAKTLLPMWTFIRTPHSEWWSLTNKSGFLRMKLRPETIEQKTNPSFIGKRQEHKNFTVIVKLDFKTNSENEEAGLVVIRDRNHYFKFTIGNNVVKLSQKTAIEKADTLMCIAKQQKSIKYLKICAKGTFYSFSYSINGLDWVGLKEKCDAHFLGIADAGRYTGTMIGMYASSNGMSSQNYVDFDFFKYSFQN